MPAKPRLNSPEDDLAFLRAIVEGGGRPPMTLAVCCTACSACSMSVRRPA